MVEFKLVISDPKTGKTTQREIKETDADRFIGLKVKDMIKGESIGLTGYEFEITGGSDDCGFPMRRDLTGTGRKKILIVKGIGLRKTKKGMKKRKMVAGNTIHAKIAQINLKIIKQGKESLFETPKADEIKEESISKEKSVKEEEKIKPSEEKPTSAKAEEEIKEA